MLASLAYHDYEGVAFRPDEGPRLQKDLGTANFLVLRNHGLLTCGPSVADAFLAMYTFENACRIQIDALAGQRGMDGLTPVPQAIVDGTAQAMRVQTGGLGGAFVWPTMLRQLEKQGAGYRT